MKGHGVEPRNYQEILATGHRRGKDFRIGEGNLHSVARCLLVAPHGGKIEPGTTEITRAVARLGGWAFYHFDGRLTRGNKDRLHITSTRFDEPELMRLLPQTEFVLSFHGAGLSKLPKIYVGGLHDMGRRILLHVLHADLGPLGFRALDATTTEHAEEISGCNPDNITNRGRIGQGVQLEFSLAARSRLFDSLTARGRRRPTPTQSVLARAIDRALRELTNQQQ